MKKYVNILFIFIMFLFLPLTVNAQDSCDSTKITIKSIEQLEKSVNTEVLEETTYNDYNLRMNLKMDEVNDYIKYKIVINNSTDEDFKLNTNSITLNGDYLEYNLEFENDEKTIKKNGDTTIVVSVKYSKAIPSSEYKNGMFNGEDSASLYLSNGMILKVPNTLKNNTLLVVLVYITMFVLIVITTILILKRRDVKKYHILILLPFLMIPISADAFCTYSVNINTKLAVKEKVAIFDTGTVVNAKIKKLAGDSDPNKDTINTSIKHVVRSNESPNTMMMTEDNIISSAESDIKIYAWFENETLYYYTSYSKPFINRNGSYMFSNLSNMLDIDLLTTNMYISENLEGFLFKATSLEEIDLNHMGGPNLSNVNYLFEYAANIKKVDMSYFDFGLTTTLEGPSLEQYYSPKSIFCRLTNVEEINLSHANMSHITKTSYMFDHLQKLTKLDFSYVDLSGTNSFERIISYCEQLTDFKMDHVDARNAKEMRYLIYYCPKIERIDFTGVNMQSVEYMHYFFRGITELREIDLSGLVADDNGRRTPKVIDMGELYLGSNKIEYINLDGCGSDYLTNASSMLYSYNPIKEIILTNFNFGKASFGSGFFPQVTDNKLELINLTGADLSHATGSGAVFDYIRNDNYVIKFVNVKAKADMSYFFYDCTPKEIVFENVDFSNTQNLYEMFYCQNSITEVDFSNYDFSNVTDMRYFLSHAQNLKKANFKGVKLGPNVNFAYFFAYCDNLEEVDFSGVDTSGVVNMDCMFYLDYKLSKVNVTEWTIKDGNNLFDLFYSAGQQSSKIEIIGLSTWTIGTGINMYSMFGNMGSENTEVIIGDLSSWKFDSGNNMGYMFYGTKSSNIINVGTLRIETPVVYYIFQNTTSIKAILIMDTDNIAVSSNFSGACTEVGSSIVVNYTSKVTNMSMLQSFINTKSTNSNVTLGELVD